MPNRKVSVALEADLADIDRLVCIRLGLDLASVGSQRQVHRSQIQRNGVPADRPVAQPVGRLFVARPRLRSLIGSESVAYRALSRNRYRLKNDVTHANLVLARTGAGFQQCQIILK